MELDLTTIVATAAFVAGISGAFLLVAGGQLQEAKPTTIWGVANIFLALGMTLIMQGRDYDLALLMVMTAGSLTWVAAARFHRRSVPVLYIVSGIAIWAALSLMWDFAFGPRASVFLAMAATYFFACAYEIWTGRNEVVPGRWPLLSLVVMAALVTMIGAIELWGYTGTPGLPPESVLWIVYIATIAFTVGTAVFFIAMTNEQDAAFHEMASLTDPLTGLANRTALLASGTAEIADAQMGGRPVAVVLFDLDYFKSINETHGKRFGDAVLQQFADVAVSCIRETDLIGRIGGEEFAAVIPGMDEEGAFAFAERVRKAFASSAAVIDSEAVTATVSAGIAVAAAGAWVEDLEELLDRADIALDGAKAAGRDCVSIFNEPQFIEPEGSFLPVFEPLSATKAVLSS